MWIPVNGTYPHVAALGAWLAGPEMYHHTFYQAFWHTAGTGWGLVADLVPLSLAGLLLAWRWRQDPATSDHFRGLRLLTPPAAITGRCTAAPSPACFTAPTRDPPRQKHHPRARRVRVFPYHRQPGTPASPPRLAPCSSKSPSADRPPSSSIPRASMSRSSTPKSAVIGY
jgi:hypothetical protein